MRARQKMLFVSVFLSAMVVFCNVAVFVIAQETPASDFVCELSANGRGVKILGYTGNGGDVIVPSVIEGLPVVELGREAFFGGFQKNNPASKITSIILPDSVVKIGKSYGDRAAFSFAWELTSVTLSNRLKEIPVGCFRYCPKLTKINLPANLKAIQAVAFNGCTELVDLIIPASLKGVKFLRGNEITPDNYAFTGCNKLPLIIQARIRNWGYRGRF
ncbi:MAG: leucine-rich repeat domain-containing protein [Spirochaetaceae bacterium]|jgi:hypothetical protein|nr:leucine-rich repeat domain-containing protein [Spirochaetaceae bacterium]